MADEGPWSAYQQPAAAPDAGAAPVAPDDSGPWAQFKKPSAIKPGTTVPLIPKQGEPDPARDLNLDTKVVPGKEFKAQPAAPSVANMLLKSQQALDERLYNQYRQNLVNGVKSSARVISAAARHLGIEEGVDYSGVDDVGFRADFALKRNDEERKAFLDDHVGAGNYRKNQYGTWVIEPAGLKKLGIDSKQPKSIGQGAGHLLGDSQRQAALDAADNSGKALPTAGMIAAGVGSGGLGFLPAIGLAFLGGAAGEAGNSLINQAEGENRLSPGQEALRILQSGGESVAGETTARALPGLVRFAGKGASPWTSPETKRINEYLLRNGMVPSLEQGLDPGVLELAKREQGAIFQTFSNSAKARNTAAAVNKLTDLIYARRGGNIADSRAIAVRALQGATDPGPAGTRAIEATRGYAMSLDKDIETLAANGRKLTDESLEKVNKQLAQADPFLYQNIGNNIQAAKNTFMGHARQLYTKVDEIAAQAKDVLGTDRLIPTSRLKVALQEVQAKYPDSWQEIIKDAGVKQTMDTIAALPKTTTARDMQVLREQLADAARNGKFVGSTGTTVADAFRRAADSTFEAALKKGGYPRRIANALRAADKFYKGGIDDFKLPEINKLMMEAKQTGRVDPENVVNFITDANHPTRMNNIIKLVTPETRKAIGTALWNNMTARARALDGSVDAGKLIEQVRRYEPHMRQIYGNQTADDMLQAARDLGAYNRVLPPEQAGGDLGRVMKDMLAKEQERDQFLKNNYLSEMLKPGFSSEQAINFMVRDQSAERAALAKRFYGADSKEWRGITAGAMEQLVSNLFRKDATTGSLSSMDGGAFNSAIKRMGDPTLEALFGKNQTKDLHELADALERLSAPQKKTGQQTAAAEALHPFAHKAGLLLRYFGGRTLARPGVIKWLTLGIKPGPRQKEALDVLEAVYKAEVYTHMKPGQGGNTGAPTVDIPDFD